ncbi:MAG: response regulator transcription factor [Candidatus Gastranaerophilales bacterium]|nr:response regulator transcription factor [Candidatus Gastranaerophilales bacterium]
MDKKYSILIVEDHALTSFALKTSLSCADYVSEIIDVNCAKDAFEALKNNNIDLILLDLGLPEIDGVEALKTIREENKTIKIVILTSHCEKDEVQKCLEHGINAYCTKEIKPDKLTEVIKDVLNGSMYFDSSVSSFVMEQTSKNSEDTKTLGNISVKDCYNLTQQEKRVLILLSSGYNNSQIAKELEISINTTKVHVCSILQKMGVEDRTQAAIKAIRENLIN